jgi:carbamoyl-phosphate synthase large subunit
VSKATGISLAKLATKVMLGKSLQDLGFTKEVVTSHISVKEAVLPFDRFPDVDSLLGPEMKSTGEVMGIDKDFGSAFAKAQLGARQNLPVEGTVFISVQNKDKQAVLPVAEQFFHLGFRIVATNGTSRFLEENNIQNIKINKVSIGRPHVVDAITNGEIQLIINTGTADEPRNDGYLIRRAALKYSIPYTTTIAGAMAICKGITAMKKMEMTVKTIQEYHN